MISESQDHVNDEVGTASNEEIRLRFWSVAPNAILAHSEMTPATKLVWLVLADMARTGLPVFLKKTTIAKRCCLSESTVSECLSRLENGGFVLVRHRKDEDTNRQKSNIYTVFGVDHTGCPQPYSVSDEPHPENGEAASGNRNSRIRKSKKPHPEIGYKREHSEREHSKRTLYLPGEGGELPEHYTKSDILAAYSKAYEDETSQECRIKPIERHVAQEAEDCHSFMRVDGEMEPAFRRKIREYVDKGWQVTLKGIVNNTDLREPLKAKPVEKAAEPELEMYRDQTNYASDWPGMGRSSK